MHAGFFAEIDDLFQAVVVLQRKGHSDLIQFVFRQDKGQVIDGTKHLDSLVNRASRHIIVQNAPYHIAPLGIGDNPVDIGFRRTRIPHQQNVFQIITAFAHQMQDSTDQRTHQNSRNRIDNGK